MHDAGDGEPHGTSQPGDRPAKVRGRLRWLLTNAQRLAVIAAASVGFFLASMAVGGGNVLLWLASAVVFVGAGMAAHRLNLHHRKNPDQIAIAEVLTVSKPPPKSVIGRCVMRVRVRMFKRAPVDVPFRDRWMPVSRWPSVGQRLPVEVWFSNPRRLRIRWDLFDLGYPRTSSRRLPLPGPSKSRPEHMTPRPRPPSEFEVRVHTQYAEPMASPARPADPSGHTSAERRRSDEPVRTELVDDQLPIPSQRPREDLTVVPDPNSPPAGADDPADEAVGAAVRAAGSIAGMLVVSDLYRSVPFYTDRLAFTIVFAESSSTVLEYQGARILLLRQADFAGVTSRAAFLLIKVPDIESAYSDLVAKGVMFNYRPKVVSRGGDEEIWVAAFRDPDGHGIALSEWRRRRG